MKAATIVLFVAAFGVSTIGLSGSSSPGSQSAAASTGTGSAGIIVSGIAANDVDKLVVAVGDQQRVLTPRPRGAFTATLRARTGDIVLTARRLDGTRTTRTLLPAPDLDGLNQRIRNGEMPVHREGGP